MAQRLGRAIGEEMHAGHQRIDTHRQFAISGHVQQRAIVTDIDRHIVTKRANTGQAGTDQIEFRHGEIEAKE